MGAPEFLQTILRVLQENGEIAPIDADEIKGNFTYVGHKNIKYSIGIIEIGNA